MNGEKMIATSSSLSDGELTADLQRLAGSERQAIAELLCRLAEFDARRLHLGAGCRSLFGYCTDVLRLSEHEAYNRIEAARLARRFPRVIDLVAAGALNLTTVRLLAPHLTDENQERLLGAASHKSKREVEDVIVQFAPRPSVPDSIRRLPTPAIESSAVGTDADVSAASRGASEGPVDGAGPQVGGREVTEGSGAQARPRPQAVRPLAADRYEIQFTAAARTCEKLRLATDLLRHAVPDGDIAEIVDRALNLLLEDLARKKFAATTRPSAKPPIAGQPRGRHIPARVKREVWLRDGGRCAFVAQNARRCEARGFLEFHHVRPYAVGGAAMPDNIQIRCRAHNAYEADLFYGSVERDAHHAKGRAIPPRRGGELVPERISALVRAPAMSVTTTAGHDRRRR